MLRVGMPQWTRRVRFGTQSVPGCIPTQSVGTIKSQGLLGMPYLRNRWAIAVWEVCSLLASCRVEG
jgi:hypothetical protein